MGKKTIRKRHSKRRACTGKEGRWDTREGARQAAAHFNATHPGYLPRITYQCPYSPKNKPHFHIGAELGRGRTPKRW